MDDITTHPRYADQIDLELEMRDGGAEAFRVRVTKAKEKHQVASLEPQRAAIRKWTPMVAEAIKEYIRAARVFERRTAASPVSLKYLKAVDPLVAAFVALRAIMNRMGSGKAGIIGCAREIGANVQHEAKLRAWEKQAPDLYYWTERHLDEDKATPIHRRRVHINRFNSLRDQGKVEWVEWPAEHVNRLGYELMELVLHSTGAFHVEDDPTFEVTPGVIRRPQKVLVMDPKVFEALGSQLDTLEYLNPIYMPTLVPPKRWDGEERGGYYSDYVEAPALIRFKASQRDQRKGAQAEYEALDLSLPKRALHALQETPWAVNPVVMRAVDHIWDNDLGEAGLPVKAVKDRFRLPPQPEGFEDDPVIRKEWRRKAAPVYARQSEALRDWMRVERTIKMARRFKGETFYFPHMFDFRGRMYPIPADLQPQGTDLARGLLTFGTPKPVTAEGIEWLAVHLANVCGQDKIPFDARIKWTMERLADWDAIERDPIGNRKLWQKAGDGKKPFQVLAAAVEFIRAYQHGPGYMSSLPVSVDGTCNGIQHLAAMIHDEDAGRAVNLLPSNGPRDIYQDVADELQETLVRISEAGGEEGEKARWWLDLCEFHLPRGLTKRPVMILPYGGTREAYFKYVKEWLKENQPTLLDREVLDQRLVGANIRFLTGHMWHAVNERLPGPLSVMKWLQDCAEAAAVGNQPVFWTTPAGFVVRHFYGKMKLHRVPLRLDGQEIVIHQYQPTKDLDKHEQLKGISPNFVHSIDASALVECLNDCLDNGIESLTAIHDAYGTHATDMWKLHIILREAFIATHEADVLGEFRRGCQEVLAGHIEHTERCSREHAWERADKILPKPLPYGTLNLRAVRDSDYFFA